MLPNTHMLGVGGGAHIQNTELRLLLDEVTPLFVSSPHSSLCWLLAPLREHKHRISVIVPRTWRSLHISRFFCGRSGNGDGGLKGSGTRVSCGKPECSLWPHSMWPSLSPPAPALLLYLCFSFGRESQEASCRSHITASNDLGKHAVDAMCTSEPCSTLERCTQSVCVSLDLCVFYLHVVDGVAPVPLGVQVAQVEGLL